MILSDYAKGVVTPRLVSDINSLASERGKIVVVDPKGPHFDYYRGVTCVTPNKGEAASASGIQIHDEESLIEAGRRLIRFWESEMVLITRGEEGMSLFVSGGRTPDGGRLEVIHIPAVAREVYDVTGAGDTVVSVFTLALACGASPPISAYIANAAAGVVVGKLGAAAVTPQEILGRWE